MADELSHDALRQLLALSDAATGGDWYIDRGLMARSLWITSWWRERRGVRDDDAEGFIASVSTERYISNKRGFAGDDIRLSKREIKNAEADAKLIVAARNALPKLVKMLLSDRELDESAWLIEWPADKHAPLRFYAAGEQAVMSANDATRFCRKQDAEAVQRAEKLSGCKVVEHLWMRPKEIDPVPAPEQVPA